jgi:hypothetical protein
LMEANCAGTTLCSNKHADNKSVFGPIFMNWNDGRVRTVAYPM